MSISPEFDFSPQNTLIIAELGTSHNGDLSKAREMVDAAFECGADCVKFQMVFADEILHPNTGEVELPTGKIRLYDRFKQLESLPEFYMEMKEYSESKGILFLCTPFGLKSAEILRNLQPKIVKIASPELNYTRLLEEVSGWDLPVLLSSGVSSLGDIERALRTLKNGRIQGHRDADGVNCNKTSICLLHCVTAYPAPETDYNLRVLDSLSMIFGIPVGVSDHSLDPELVPVLSIGQGAGVIEKHFCLSRSDSGLDDPIALPPILFSRMVHAVRRAEKAGAEESLMALICERGEKLVEEILGSGVKTLAPSEEANYHRTNRSIHAMRNIKKGEIIRPEDFRVLRTEKNLKPGLDPYWEPFIAGRIAQNFIPDGEGICFEDLTEKMS